MSHVTSLDLHIKDLDSLAKAAAACGLEFVKGQTSYRWYGTQGDYPCPAGFTPADLGKCSHALRLPGGKGYEVGVVERRDGKPGYTLLWDFWNGGYGLRDAIGTDGVNLRNQYAAQVAVKQMKRKGFNATIKTTPKGLQVLCTK